MPFATSCPECSAKLTSSKPIEAGRSLTCPKCKAKFVTGSSTDSEPESDERDESREHRPRERASRRDDDRDDDAPRRRRRDSFDDDERDDDDDRDYPPRRTVPGRGLGIAGMTIGIISVVIAFGSSGPYLCAFCCIFLLPFTWIISGFDTALSVTGLLLSIFSRKAATAGKWRCGGSS